MMERQLTIDQKQMRSYIGRLPPLLWSVGIFCREDIEHLFNRTTGSSQVSICDYGVRDRQELQEEYNRRLQQGIYCVDPPEMEHQHSAKLPQASPAPEIMQKWVASNSFLKRVAANAFFAITRKRLPVVTPSVPDIDFL